MAHLHKKIKKGRPYYYVREIARVDGKPTVVRQVYLGSPERMLQMALSAQGGLAAIECQEFGALWLANLIEKDIGIAEIVDAVVPGHAREKGPSVGEYFLYAVYNRMVDACSKRALPDWYRSTAIHAIRPVDVDALTSQRYWEKWDRVSQAHLERIADVFFRKVNAFSPAREDCFLFDTTNYFTFMASDTPSELAKRGKNKEGRDWLRQVGVALLVSRDHEIPLYYKEYEGNRHDSKVFARLLDDIFEAMRRTGRDDSHLTLVVDKGMNSDDNMAVIDGNARAHFITTYSLYHAEDLGAIPLSRFQPVDTIKNRRLVEHGREHDLLVAYRTTRELWGRERTVVVTYNPRTASKQRYGFDQKLDAMQSLLYEMRAKFRGRNRGWTHAEDIEKRYREFCNDMHMPHDLYEIEFSKDHLGSKMSFRKSHYRISKHIQRFGKNLIVTDNIDWTTDEIVQASLDRYKVEMGFRQTKDDDIVAVQPIRHWTDSKISCHILTCIMALACIRLLEARLLKHGVDMTGATAMGTLHTLHSCLCLSEDRKAITRMIEAPTPEQARILRCIGYEVGSGGVLREIEG